MLSVENLTKSFQGHEVVKNVSFSLKANTATALIGPNGAGKTTILSMLAGLLEQTAGTISMADTKNMRAEIGFLPQYPKFFEALTAREFIEMCGNLNGMSKKAIQDRIEEVFAFVGLTEAMNKKTSTFSGGMKQRLGIAQAIFHKPKLLLLDEPVSALDPVGRREMMDLLKQLQQETTILYSTHILNDAEQMTDQLLFLMNGQLVEQGSLVEMKKKYAEDVFVVTLETHEHVAELMKCIPFPAKQDGLNVKIIITNNDPTMRGLLQFLAKLPFDVQKIEKQTASLEDIFVKVAMT